MAKVFKTVSMYDVCHLLAKGGVNIKDVSKEDLNKALYSIGFQEEGIEIETDILHRPIFSPNNEPWLGSRFIGFERQDREWLCSKHSTLENIIGSQTDRDHQRDLIMMSVQSNNTADIIDHAVNKRDVSKGEKN